MFLLGRLPLRRTFAANVQRWRYYCSYNLDNYLAVNEPVLPYLADSKETCQLQEKLFDYDSRLHDVPIVIGEKEYRPSEVKYQVRPYDHKNNLAKFYYADQTLLKEAIEVSQKARHDWELQPLSKRCEVLLKAADLVCGKYRMDLMAATMLGQSKTIIQGEIDCIAELADFFRFNVQAALDLHKWSPINAPGVENRLQYRGMEGFWAAVAPFNFTAISGNLSSAPALMGNVVLWKPSDTAILSSYLIFQILREAGLPPGVINFTPAHGPVFGDTVLSSSLLAGVNFTGSSKTFLHLWKQLASNIENYQNFPRMVGECGGKNFHLVHPSADLENVVNTTVASAFEFGGQKCSACSRMYVPRSKWHEIKKRLVEELNKVKVGDPRECDTYFSAVIDDKAFERIKAYIDLGRKDLNVVFGATYDDSEGYYIQPTVFETEDPNHTLMKEEIFGPVLTVYQYEDETFTDVLDLVNETTAYALTGSIYAEDLSAVELAREKLRFSAGNFYINDKCTGSVVCQQPFGGARKSGTNDKAGSPHYVLKFASPLSIKTRLDRATTWDYPYMKA